MKQIAKWISHNQGMFTTLIICAVLFTWGFCCASKVTSLVEPAKMVTAAELDLEIDQESSRLQAELDMLLKRAQLKKVELARQDEIKRKLFDFAAITVDAGTVNPAGVVGLIFSVFGIGAVIDNRIKDKVIKNRPLKVPPPEAMKT